MKLKNNLKVLIIMKGYKSMKQFCEVHDLTYDTISRLASGRSETFYFDTITKICVALDCEIGDLFYIEKNTKEEFDVYQK